MKQKLLLLLGMFVVELAQAGNVTSEEAQAKAEAFMKTRHATIKRQPMKLAKRAKQQKQDEAATYYVFNATDNNGFVIVSGDDRTPAILGYADNGTFDNGNVPENMQAWLDEYARQIDFLSTHPTAPIAAAPVQVHEAVKPLVTTKWNQGAPYNLLCPTDEGKPTYTGCGATAMAQILAYYKYPARTTKGIPAYTTNTKKIFVDSIPPTDIDWANMLDTYTGNETEAQNLAVATLMKVCGASVYMDYTNYASGAAPSYSGDALKNYFDFDASTSVAERNNYSSSEWDNMIYNELVHNRPVFYSAFTITAGHGFIIDGYDGNGLYHVNWGWGGTYDGYFLLSVLNTHQENDIDASYNMNSFSINHIAIIGAQPNTGIPFVSPKMISTYFIWPEKTTFLKNETDSFNISFVCSMYNFTGGLCKFNHGIGVYNTDNEMVYSIEYDDVDILEPDYGWSYFHFDGDIPALPDGDYIIVPISREDGTETWYKNEYSNEYFLTATIKGDTLTLTAPTIDLYGKIEGPTNVEIGMPVKVNTTITNNGTRFYKNISLLVNGEQKVSCRFEIEKGETKTLTMSYTPEEAGTDSLSLCYIYNDYDYDNDQMVEFFYEIASTVITVTPPLSQSLTFSDAQVANADGENIIGDFADIMVNVTNTGTNDYNDYLLTYVLKYDAASGVYASKKDVLTPVSINAGITKSVRINVSGLNDGLYWFVTVYKSDGQYTDIDNNELCCSLKDYTVSVPTAIEAPKTSVQTPAIVIFNLQGQRVQNPRKGLYIENGHKVVIK